MSDPNFFDKVAVVTGGAQGIGKSFCQKLLEHGAKVCILDKDEDIGKSTLNELRESFKENVYFVKCDVSIISEYRGAIEKTIEMFNKVDIIINNAGFMDEKDWRKMIDTNFIGVINGIMLAFEFMSNQNKGSGGVVVNVASNAGLAPFPLSPVYSGCKHGVVGLTRSFGDEYHYKKSGVTVNAICPGPVDTQLFYTFPENSIDSDAAKMHNNRVTPISAAEVADALINLLSEKRNGSLLRVNSDGFEYV